ncbi:MAG: hypothetical protein JXR10_16170, partial [Cyclobacteriaceae bacterium]
MKRILLFTSLLIVAYFGYSQVTLTNGADAELDNISSLLDQSSGPDERFILLDFGITDPGGGGASDITAITVNIPLQTGITDWSTILADALLVDLDDAGTMAGVIGTNTITFSPIAAGGGDIGDIQDQTKTYNVLVRFQTTGIGSIIDQVPLYANIDQTTVTSSLGVPNPATISSNNSKTNIIDVTATEYRFLAQPSATNTDAVMSPAVTFHATDVNGNRDIGYNAGSETVTVSSTGTFTGEPLAPSSWSAGVATMGDIIHTVGGAGLQLSTSGGLLSNNATSSSFTITDITPPSVSSAVTIDNDGNGTVDYIKLTFTEAVSDASVAAGDFVVSIAGTDPSTDGGHLTESFTSGMPNGGTETDTPNDAIIYV